LAPVGIFIFLDGVYRTEGSIFIVFGLLYTGSGISYRL